MTNKNEKFSAELDALISEGELLQLAMIRGCDPDAFKKNRLKSLGNDEKIYDALVAKLPNFGNDYQAWYTKDQALIRQVTPDRLGDFISYFEPPKNRKEITFQNYMVLDYLQGLRATRSFGEVLVAGQEAALPEFNQQLQMVKAARAVLDSALMDLKAVLQADLFDSEVDSARALAKAGYLRAAGAICGVVIEKHLLHVCGIHRLTVTKKNPGIADLNQKLRDGEVTTIPQWRFVQHLADLRNICDHAKGREPTTGEIADLVEGTEKILKTIF